MANVTTDPLIQQQIIDALNNADYSEVVMKLINADPTLAAKVSGIMSTAVFNLSQSAATLKLDTEKINKELSKGVTDTFTLSKKQKDDVAEKYKKALSDAIEKIEISGKIDLSSKLDSLVDNKKIAKPKSDNAFSSLAKKMPFANKMKGAGDSRKEEVFKQEAIKVVVEDWGKPAKDYLEEALGGIKVGKDEKPKKGKSMLSKMFAGMGSLLMGATGLGILGKFMKFGPIAAIAGGLIWAAFDGIKGWFKAKEWGTSKVSAALGAAVAGTGKGMKNAFKNAGKWALTGAGIGLLAGGPLGALVGGLLGAALGGILGWIGGQKVAKFFDKVGGWFKKNFLPLLKKIGDWFKDVVWPAMKQFGAWVGEKMVAFWEWVKPILKKVGDWFVNDLWPAFKEFAVWVGEKMVKFWEWMKPIMKKIGEWFKQLMVKVWPYIQKYFELLGKFYVWMFKNIGPAIDKFISGFKKFGTAIGEGAAMIWDWSSNFLKNIKDKFVFFGKSIGEGAFMIIDGIKNGVMDFFEGLKNAPKWLLKQLRKLPVIGRLFGKNVDEEHAALIEKGQIAKLTRKRMEEARASGATEEEIEAIRQRGLKVIKHKEANDFVWRSGNPPQILPFSKDDNVVGVKDKDSRTDFNNIGALNDTNLYLQQMKNGIDKLLMAMQNLNDISRQQTQLLAAEGQAGDANDPIATNLKTSRGYGGDYIHDYHLDVWKAMKLT